MSEMSPVAKDAPVMVAWEAYKSSGDYQNTRNWALHKAHVDGSLWAAFEHGYRIAGQSRIAEVGRLEERVRELGGGCEANDGGMHSIMGGDKEPFCPDCGLMLKRIAYVLPHLKPNDVRAALSLQRRV